MMNGIVKRSHVETKDRSTVQLTLMLEGDKTIYQGQMYVDKDPSLFLIKPGDEVSFNLSRDFVDVYRDFKNITLEAEVAQ